MSAICSKRQSREVEPVGDFLGAKIERAAKKFEDFPALVSAAAD